MSANSGKCNKTDIIAGGLPRISFYQNNNNKKEASFNSRDYRGGLKT